MRHSLGWILIGLVAGWLAGKVTHGAGLGCLANVLQGFDRHAVAVLILAFMPAAATSWEAG